MKLLEPEKRTAEQQKIEPQNFEGFFTSTFDIHSPSPGLPASGGILCSLLQRESAFAKGYGPIKWRGDRAVARESEGG
jgi:hypothetical protein